MTQLTCSAATCLSNCGGLCAMHNIHVDGSTAERSRETCCGSFIHRPEGLINEAVPVDVRPETSIRCHAHECVYNSGMACTAGAVQIEGGDAVRCGDTCCRTFKPKN